ncbi:MAG: cytochrome P450 [Actinobacteria bacterium]|nr:cytochrome P450 [Actinomycetota bacterium]
MLDGPAHTRLRRLVSRAFTPRTVERLRPRVEALAEELIEPMAAAGGGDLMSELAFPFPVRVVAELVGVPEADCDPFRDRTMRITAIFELDATEDQLAAADAAQREADDYFAELIEFKRAHPGEDHRRPERATESASPPATQCCPCRRGGARSGPMIPTVKENRL